MHILFGEAFQHLVRHPLRSAFSPFFQIIAIAATKVASRSNGLGRYVDWVF
jgi:hypothetical protein